MGLKIISGTRLQFGRRNTFLRGTIYSAGNPHMPCAVRELTLSGAQLVVASSAPLPQTFHLLVDSSGFEPIAQSCNGPATGWTWFSSRASFGARKIGLPSALAHV